MEDIKEIKEKLIKSVIRQTPHTGPGGQIVGMYQRGVSLYSEETGFKITIDNYRSQIKNLELALQLFELYLDEVIK
jgi:protein subunit release factor B